MLKPSSDLVAHRGYPLHYPENTLPGIEAALEAGANYVEVDIQLSRDGVPVLFHDRDLQRLCGRSGVVHEYDVADLGTFVIRADAGSQPRLAQAPLALLQQLVRLIQQHPRVTFFIELKRISIEQFGARRMLDAVLALLQPVRKQCVIISYSLALLQETRDNPGWPLGAVIDAWPEHAKPAIAALKPEYLFFDIRSLPPTPVTFADSVLVAFECTDPQQARRAMQQGVHLIETFAIGEMREQLGMR